MISGVLPAYNPGVDYVRLCSAVKLIIFAVGKDNAASGARRSHPTLERKRIPAVYIDRGLYPTSAR